MKINTKILKSLKEAKIPAKNTLEDLCNDILKLDEYDAPEYFIDEFNVSTINKLENYFKKNFNISILDYANFVVKKYSKDRNKLHLLTLPLAQIIFEERKIGKLKELFNKYNNILLALPKKFLNTMVEAMANMSEEFLNDEYGSDDSFWPAKDKADFDFLAYEI